MANTQKIPSDFKLTDAEIDSLLERFDQTEPAMQRKIVANLICRLVILSDSRDDLLAACRSALRSFDIATSEGLDINFEAYTACRNAIAKAVAS